MPSFGSITMKRACSISARPTSNDSSCIRIIDQAHPSQSKLNREWHASEDHDYLHAAAESIADAGAVLITGPANAKTELVKHIHHHDPKLMNVIVGVETVDHPSDGQLVAYARKYFKATDRMQPQKA
jgi:stalled ribosome rescue protein Dom34